VSTRVKLPFTKKGKTKGESRFEEEKSTLWFLETVVHFKTLIPVLKPR
jgi:hypothetical protein